MKSLSSILSFLLLSALALAQSPNAINYQAVLRNAQGDLIKSKSVSIRLSVLKGSATGSSVYTETHSTSTNEYGMVNLQIGNGTTSNNFSSIGWGSDAHYLKVELDETGGSSYKNLGTTQLVSVPYSMFANTAKNVENADQDSTNELQTLSIVGNKLSLSGNGGTVTIPTGGGGGSDFDQDSTNELQTLSLSGKTLSLSGNGGSVTLNTDDNDADASNELQKLSISGNKLTLSNTGGTVTLPGGGSSLWSKSGDTLSYAKHVNVGSSGILSSGRLRVGAMSGSGNRIGIDSRVTGGTGINFGLNSEVFAGNSATANNVALMGTLHANAESGSAFRGIVDGDSTGFGSILNVSTSRVNVGYSTTTNSANGTGFIQYGGDFFAEGSGSGDHFGIRAVGQGTGTSTASGSSNYGGIFFAGGTGKNFGIGAMGRTFSQHFINVGLYGISSGSATTGYNYGLVASASNADTNYAAYFFGDVTYTGALTGPSDARLKMNVNQMESTSAMDKIMSLRPVTYDYKTEEYDFMKLPEGTQFGFIAQEVETVFPELVNTQVTPVFTHSDNDSLTLESGSGIENGELFRYQGVNYVGLIPVLTSGVQEQQTEIDELKDEVAELKKQNEELRQMVEALIKKEE